MCSMRRDDQAGVTLVELVVFIVVVSVTIAGVLGVKTASVKLLLFRARRRLARLLGHPAKGGA